MRLVGCVLVRAATALLTKGWAGSGLIGPWPSPAGGSCQSATFDCQPKSAEARLGILSFGSASAAEPSAAAATNPVKTPPASITRADELCFEMDPDIKFSSFPVKPAPSYCDVWPARARRSSVAACRHDDFWRPSRDLALRQAQFGENLLVALADGGRRVDPRTIMG